MFKMGSAFNYLPLDSHLHKLDPRTKMLLVTSFMINVLTADYYGELVLLGLMAVIMVKLSRVPLRYYWQGMKPLVILVTVSALIQAIFLEGGRSFDLGLFTVSETGLRLGVLLIVKLVLVLLVVQMLMLTTSTLALTDGLGKIIHPLTRIGFPVEELLMIMAIALRFIPLITDEALEVKKAQTARGADFSSGSLIQRLKKQLLIIVPVFNLSLQRTDALTQAMESRAYVPGAARSRLHELIFKSADYWWMAGAVVLTVFIILL